MQYSLAGINNLNMFECTIEEVAPNPDKSVVKGSIILLHKYNREKSEMLAISSKDKRGENPNIYDENKVGKRFAVYEKEGKIYWKDQRAIGYTNQFILNPRRMILKIKLWKEDSIVHETNWSCRKR